MTKNFFITYNRFTDEITLLTGHDELSGHSEFQLRTSHREPRVYLSDLANYLSGKYPHRKMLLKSGLPRDQEEILEDIIHNNEYLNKVSVIY